MGFFLVHLLAGGSYSYTMPTGSQIGAETRSRKNVHLAVGALPDHLFVRLGKWRQVHPFPALRVSRGSRDRKAEQQPGEPQPIDSFVYYPPVAVPDCGSTTDCSGSIRNVQISAPISITPAETKKGAIQ